MVSAFPFPIQRLQTDRGEEFMALAVQNRLRELAIKFRPIKPRGVLLPGQSEVTRPAPATTAVAGLLQSPATSLLLEQPNSLAEMATVSHEHF